MSSETGLEHTAFYQEFKVEKKPNSGKTLTMVFLKIECLKGLYCSGCAVSASTDKKPCWAPPDSARVPHVENSTGRFHYNNCATVNSALWRNWARKHKGAKSRWSIILFPDTVFTWVVFTRNIHLVIAQIPCCFNIISMVNAISYCTVVI